MPEMPQMTWQGMPNQGAPEAKAPLLKRINYVGVVASILLAISVFVPSVSIEFFGIKTTEAFIQSKDGMYFIILAIAGLVLSFLEYDQVMLIIGAFSCIRCVMEYFGIKKNIPSEYHDYLNYEIGFYLAVIASVLLIVSVFVKKLIQKKNA